MGPQVSRILVREALQQCLPLARADLPAPDTLEASVGLTEPPGPVQRPTGRGCGCLEVPWGTWGWVIPPAGTGRDSSHAWETLDSDPLLLPGCQEGAYGQYRCSFGTVCGVRLDGRGHHGQKCRVVGARSTTACGTMGLSPGGLAPGCWQELSNRFPSGTRTLATRLGRGSGPTGGGVGHHLVGPGHQPPGPC